MMGSGRRNRPNARGQLALAGFLLWIAGSGARAIEVAVAPASMQWDANAWVELTVTDVAPGSAVELRLYVDVNRDETVDPADVWLAEFGVTDGVTNAWGSQVIVCDTNGLSDGTIQTRISYHGLSDDAALWHAAGEYLWEARLADGSDSVAAAFSITQPASTVWLTGTACVLTNLPAAGLPRPGTLVAAEYFSPLNGFSPAAWTDTNGEFRIYIPTNVSRTEVRGVSAVGLGCCMAERGPDSEPLSTIRFAQALNIGENALDRPLYVVPSMPGSGMIYTLSGHLTNDLGQPVRAALVVAEMYDDDSDVYALAMTDGNGDYQVPFPPADSAVTVYAANHFINLRGLVGGGTGIGSFLADQAGIDLCLSQATSLMRGAVTNVGSLAGFDGVEVEALGNAQGSRSFTFNTNGMFELGADEGNGWVVSVEAETLEPRRHIPVPAESPSFSMPASGIFSGPELQFTAMPAWVLSGRVLDVQSNGIAGGQVWANDYDTGEGGDNADVDLAGCYGLLLADGAYRVGTADYGAMGYDNVTLPDPIVIAGQDVSERNILLQSGAQISGTVWAGGNPLEGANVQAWLVESNLDGGIALVQQAGETNTDANGNYVLTVASEADYAVRVQPNLPPWLGQYYSNASEAASATRVSPTLGTPATGIDFELMEGALIGGSVRADGEPLEHVSVQVFLVATNEEDGGWSYQGVAETLSEADGSYLVAVPPGVDYYVAVMPEDAQWVSQLYSNAFGIASATTVQPVVGTPCLGIDFNLVAAAIISGQVLQDGNPVAGATVNASVDVDPTENWSLQNVAWDMTDAEGCYVLGVFPGGSYYVGADSAGLDRLYFNDVLDVAQATAVVPTIEAPATNVDFHYAASEPGGTIRGHVFEDDGVTPLANCRVYTPEFESSNWITQADTDAEGNYSLQVPAGWYRVRAVPAINGLRYESKYFSNTYYAGTAEMVTVPEGGSAGPIDFTLASAGAISGRIYLADGVTPLENCRVGAEEVSSAEWLAWDDTAADGSYALVVPAGSYHVQALPSANGERCLDEFYDGVFSREEAAEVVVEGTNETGGIDFTLDAQSDEILGWGESGSGQCQIPKAATAVVAIAGGGYHGLALRMDGTVIGWGENSTGQATVPSNLTSVVGIAAGFMHSLALRADGTVAAWGWGDWYPAPTSAVVAIAAGNYHNLALLPDGTVHAWGDNSWGQCTPPTRLHGVVAVAAGASHSLALRADGTVAAWGANDNGQTEIPLDLSNAVAIAAGGNHSLALRADGTVAAWGADWAGQTESPPDLSNVVAIAAGGNHSLALRADGTVAAWGADWAGQTESPPDLSNVVAIAAGDGYSLALFGHSISGQVRYDGAGVEGAGVAASGLGGVATAADGIYRFQVPLHWTGTLTPAYPCGMLSPATYDYAIPLEADAVAQDFSLGSLDAPGAFALSSPANNAEAVDEVSLNWSAANCAAVYDVYVGAGVDPVRIATVSTNRLVLPVRANGNHEWYVVARNAAGTSRAPETGAWVFDGTWTAMPPGPVGFTVVEAGRGTQLELSWSNYNETANGGDIDYYTVYRADEPFTDVEQATAVAEVAAGVKGCTVTGLVREVTRYYAVVATDRDGLYDPEVTPLAATPHDVVAPFMPWSLWYESGWSNLTVHWMACPDEDADLAGYRIYFNENPTPIQVGAETTEYAWTDLTPATGYILHITALDETGNESDGFTAIGATLLENPGNVAAQPFSGVVDLTWDDSEPTNLVAGYAVYCRTSDYNSVEGLSPAAYFYQPSGSVAGLQNNVNYHFAVVAVNQSGGFDRSVATVSAMPLPDTNGPALSNPRIDAEALTNGLLVVRPGQIQAEATDRAGVARMEFWVDGTNRARIVAGPTFGWFWNVVSAVDGPHEIRLKAVDTFGNSTETSAWVQVLLAAPTSAPAITTPADQARVNKTSLTIQGTADACAQSVTVYLNGSPAGTAAVGSSGAFYLPVTLGEQTNWIRAAAVNRGGEGPLSDEIQVAVDTNVPSAPMGLVAAGIEGGQVQLGWAPVSGAAGYWLYRSTSPFDSTGAAELVNPDILTELTYQDLPPVDGTYYYRVLAESQAGTPSALSLQVQAISDRLAPRVEWVEYASDGPADLANNRYGQGLLQVQLKVSEELLVVPFFSLNVPDSQPISVSLKRSSTNLLLYSGSFRVYPGMCGTAYAVVSCRDKIGNRGTEVDAGECIVLDSCGPVLGTLRLTPADPIENDGSGTMAVAVAAEFAADEIPVTAPQLEFRLAQTQSDWATVELTQQTASTWGGTVTLPATAGSATESLEFRYQGLDDLGNVGTLIAAGQSVQVYQGVLPPLDAPTGLRGQALAGGQVQLDWNAVAGAEDYVVFKGAASNDLACFQPSAGALTWSENAGGATNWYAVASIREANSQVSTSALCGAVRVVADAEAPATPSAPDLMLTGSGMYIHWPALAETGVKYAVYRSTSNFVSVAGLEPLAGDISSTNALDYDPPKGLAYYAVTARDAAGNESTPSLCAHTNLALVPVNSLNVRLMEGGRPTLRWTHAYPEEIAGYHLYIGEDSGRVLAGSYGAATTNFTDAGYNGAQRLYSVAAYVMDGSEEVESVSRSVLLPKVALTPATNNVLKRGVMNRLNYALANESGDLLTDVQVHAVVVGIAHQTVPFQLAAAGATNVAVIVGGYTNLPAVATLTNALTFESRQGQVELVSCRTVAAGEDRLVAELANDEFTKGSASGKVRFTVRNTSTEEIEVVTALAHGSQDSDEVQIRLEDREGNVLSAVSPRQMLGNGVITLTDGTTVARIAAGASFTSSDLTLAIPTNAPVSLRLRLTVSRIHYHLGETDQVAMSGPGATLDLNLVDTIYVAAVTNVAPAQSLGPTNFLIQGQALNRQTGNPQQNVPVKVVVAVKGFQRTYQVTSDGNGEWALTFVPLATESGLYDVWAVHPTIEAAPVQAQFRIDKVNIVPAEQALTLARNSLWSQAVSVGTGEGLTLTNLHLAYLPEDQPGGTCAEGISVVSSGTVAQLAPQSTGVLRFTVLGDDTAPSHATIVLRVTSAGAPTSGWGRVLVDLALVDSLPILDWSPSYLETGVQAGKQVTGTIRLLNRGYATMEDVAVSLVTTNGETPPDWTRIISGRLIGDLPAGTGRDVQMVFAPSNGVAEGGYAFNLEVRSSNLAMRTIPVFLNLDNTGRGTAIFKITDFYTGTTNQLGQLVEGAQGVQILLQKEILPGETFLETNQTTDAAGEAEFGNLPEGTYVYQVSSTRHETLTGRIRILPGSATALELMLQNRLVQFEWAVNEISVEDRYEIVLNMTFETDVPAPVVVVTPALIRIPADMRPGDVFNGEFHIANHGLIRAESVHMGPPDLGANYKMELLAELPDTLEAQAVARIPYRITCLSSPLEDESGGAASLCPYIANIPIDYKFRCVNGTLVMDVVYIQVEMTGPCPVYVEGGGGSVPTTPVSIPVGKPCPDDPCTNEFICCGVGEGSDGPNFPGHSWNYLLTGDYRDMVFDIEVKVAGGMVGIRRDLVQNQWIFSELFGHKNLGEATNVPAAVTSGVAQVQYVYDDDGRLTIVRDHFTNQVLWIEYVETFDGTQRVARVQDASGRAVTYDYDWQGRLTNVVDVAGYSTAYAYDAQGRLIRKDLPTGEQVEIAYNNNGQVAEMNGIQFEYEKISSQVYVGSFWVWRGGTNWILKPYYVDQTVGHRAIVKQGGREKELLYDETGKRTTDEQLAIRLVGGSNAVDTALVGGFSVQTSDTAEEESWPRLSYNERGDVTCIEHENGLKETTEYNGPLFQRSRHVDMSGNVTAWLYNENGWLTQEVTDVATVMETTSTLEYDSLGNCLALTHVGNGRPVMVWNWTYDESGNQLTATDPWGDVNSNAWDNQGNLMWTRSPEGAEWRNTYEPRGLIASTVDPLGRMTTNRYDAAGNLVWSSNSMGQVATWTYSAEGKLLETSNTRGEKQTWEYDDQGRAIRATGYDGVVESFEYGADGRMIIPVTNSFRTLTNSFGQLVFGYSNEVGQVNEVVMSSDGIRPLEIRAPGLSNFYHYNVEGILTQRIDRAASESRTNSWELDDYGQVVRHVDPAGRMTSYEYDDFGRGIQCVNPMGKAVGWAYDSYGMVGVITDAQSRVIGFDRDFQGRQTVTKYPDGSVEMRDKDRNNRLIMRVDARGRMARIDYDLVGRMTNMACFASINATQPDTMAWMAYDDLDRLIGYGGSDSPVIYSIEYDDDTHTRRITVDYGDFTKSYAYQYDDNGRLHSFESPDGSVQTYSYTPDASLEQIEVSGLGVFDFAYDQQAQSIETTFPGGANRVAIPDTFGQLGSLQVRDSGGNVLVDRVYRRNPVDQIIEIRDENMTNMYAYDAAGQMIQSYTGVTSTYGYDVFGNRVSTSYDPGVWTYDNMNRLLAWPSGSYAYDGNGVVTARVVNGVTQSYEYDLYGNLITVRDAAGELIARYGYDPSAQRVRKEVGGQVTWYLYSDEGLIGEYDENGNAIREYAWKPGSPWMTAPLFLKNNGSYWYYIHNHLGAPETLLSQSGEVAWRADYDAYGRPLTGRTNNIFNPLVLSGQYRDEETGLHYNTRRYYDPLTSRYLARDPLGYEEGLNGYQFANNDPVNVVDNTGLAGVAVHFYMTFLVAVRGGMSFADAYQLAAWSQYPDADAETDAVLQQAKLSKMQANGPYNPAYHENPNAYGQYSYTGAMLDRALYYEKVKEQEQHRDMLHKYVHHLNGNSPQKNQCWRNVLKSAITSANNEPDWKGLLMHSYQDTWFHIDIEDDNPITAENYPLGTGHAKQNVFGDSPDLLAVRTDRSTNAINGMIEALFPNTFDQVKGTREDLTAITWNMGTLGKLKGDPGRNEDLMIRDRVLKLILSAKVNGRLTASDARVYRAMKAYDPQGAYTLSTKGKSIPVKELLFSDYENDYFQGKLPGTDKTGIMTPARKNYLLMRIKQLLECSCKAEK